jgi:hypothetical protein
MVAFAFCRKHFPSSTAMSLEAVSDPDAPLIPESLFVLLKTSLPIIVAMERLQELELEWIAFGIDPKSLINFDLGFA